MRLCVCGNLWESCESQIGKCVTQLYQPMRILCRVYLVGLVQFVACGHNSAEHWPLAWSSPSIDSVAYTQNEFLAGDGIRAGFEIQLDAVKVKIYWYINKSGRRFMKALPGFHASAFMSMQQVLSAQFAPLCECWQPLRETLRAGRGDEVAVLRV